MTSSRLSRSRFIRRSLKIGLIFSTTCTALSAFLLSNNSKVGKETSLSSWSKIVEIERDAASRQTLRLVETEHTSTNDRSERQNHSLDPSKEYALKSPREWLEFCESRRNESFIPSNRGPGHPDFESRDGAYTVLRCDFLLTQTHWRIWGKGFHWNRLKESYRLLLQKEKGTYEINEQHEQFALETSEKMLNVLLSEATTAISSIVDMRKVGTQQHENPIVVAMITLLWDQDPGGDDAIRVRGHGFSSLSISQIQHNGGNDITLKNPNSPVEAVVGYVASGAWKNTTSSTGIQSKNLPNRYEALPQAKLSSWCRRRRRLEKLFKKDGIGDVLLAKDHRLRKDTKDSTESSQASESSSIELLEGLTSNLFVLYPANVLKTAPTTDVLGGYVRDLIIKCAEDCGYEIEYGGIEVEDCSQWKEVFLSSSIRLIVPVKKIFLPVANNDDGGVEFERIWKIPHDCEKQTEGTLRQLATNVLYREVMKRANGIPCSEQ